MRRAGPRRVAGPSDRRRGWCGPGATTAAIDRAIAEHFEQLGAQPLFKNYPNSIATSRRFPPSAA